MARHLNPSRDKAQKTILGTLVAAAGGLLAFFLWPRTSSARDALPPPPGGTPGGEDPGPGDEEPLPGEPRPFPGIPGGGIVSPGAGGPQPNASPQPNQFYTIRAGDNLLDVAEQAYGTSGADNLAASQTLNGSQYNERFWIKPDSILIPSSLHAFNVENYPQGVISFSSRYTCNLAQQARASVGAAPSGSCYATIWIPDLVNPREPTAEELRI